MLDILIVGLLFVCLTPGLLTKIPSKGSPMTVALVHALIFAALFYLACKILRYTQEGFDTAINPGTPPTIMCSPGSVFLPKFGCVSSCPAGMESLPDPAFGSRCSARYRTFNSCTKQLECGVAGAIFNGTNCKCPSGTFFDSGTRSCVARCPNDTTTIPDNGSFPLGGQCVCKSPLKRLFGKCASSCPEDLTTFTSGSTGEAICLPPGAVVS